MKVLNIINKKLINYNILKKKNELINLFYSINNKIKIDKYLLIKKKKSTLRIKKIIQNIIIIKTIFINSPLIKLIKIV